MPRLTLALVLVVSVRALGFAQDVTVSRSNKSVEVTVTATVEADPEAAVLSLGTSAFGRTHDAAFGANMSAAAHILGVLAASGIPSGGIETSQFLLNRVEQTDDKWTTQERAERQYVASQSWEVRVNVGQAQCVLDEAVKAGANEMTDVHWQVKRRRCSTKAGNRGGAPKSPGSRAADGG